MAKKNVEEKNEVKEKSKAKRYGILFLIFALCVGLTLYLCKWYDVYDEYQKEIPVIRGTLSEVDFEEFEHYILDNSSIIVYMCTSQSEVCRNFENDLKKLVKKNAYADEIIYLNLSNMDQDQFIKDFNDKYKFKTALTKDYPAFVFFRDGEIEALLQGSESNPLTISKTKNFIEIYKVGE